MNRFLILWILAAGMTLSLGVGAEEKKTNPRGSEASAASEYRKGKVAFEAGDFKGALEAFTEAYNLSDKPDLLYNLAVCSEKNGNNDKAIAFYQLYLEEKPDAPDADQVKARLKELKKEEETKGEIPVGGAAIVSDEGGPTQPAPGADTEVAVPEGDPEEPAFELPEEETKEVFWPGVIIGTGAIVAATGALAAISAYKKHSDLDATCAPECKDKQVQSVKDRALAADVLMIIGGAAVAGGVIWWMVDNGEEDAGEAASVGVVPLAWGSGGGILVEGRF